MGAEFAMTDEADFFRSRLDQMIDLRHPLAVLASRMPWQEIEASIAHAFAKKVRSGKKIEDEDLFGPVSGVVGGGVSPAGRPRVPLRLMISLLYLKHAYNESDEGVVERWSETPTWQYFSGLAYFEHRWPCDPTLLVRFRKALGEEGVEALLAQTIQVALTLKLIARKDLATVIVDSTVQAKAVAYPTDIRMLETARAKLVEAAREAGIPLKQTYAKEGRALSAQAGRYAHARQFRRMRKAIKSASAPWWAGCSGRWRARRPLRWPTCCAAPWPRPPVWSSRPDTGRPRTLRASSTAGMRPGGALLQQGQGQNTLRVRRQGGAGHHGAWQLDRRGAGLVGSAL